MRGKKRKKIGTHRHTSARRWWRSLPRAPSVQDPSSPSPGGGWWTHAAGSRPPSPLRAQNNPKYISSNWPRTGIPNYRVPTFLWRSPARNAARSISPPDRTHVGPQFLHPRTPNRPNTVSSACGPSANMRKQEIRRWKLHCASHRDGFQAENPLGSAAHGGRNIPGGSGAILTGRIMYSRSGFLRLCLFFLSLLTSPLPALVVAILAYERCERGTARPHPDSFRLLSPGSGEQLLMLNAEHCAVCWARRQATAAAAQTSPIEPLSPNPPHLLCSPLTQQRTRARTHSLSQGRFTDPTGAPAAPAKLGTGASKY